MKRLLLVPAAALILGAGYVATAVAAPFSSQAATQSASKGNLAEPVARRRRRRKICKRVCKRRGFKRRCKRVCRWRRGRR